MQKGGVGEGDRQRGTERGLITKLASEPFRVAGIPSTSM